MHFLEETWHSEVTVAAEWEAHRLPASLGKPQSDLSTKQGRENICAQVHVRVCVYVWREGCGKCSTVLFIPSIYSVKNTADGNIYGLYSRGTKCIAFNVYLLLAF